MNSRHLGTDENRKNLPLIQGGVDATTESTNSRIGTFLRVLLVGLIAVGIRLNQEEFGFGSGNIPNSISIPLVKSVFPNAVFTKDVNQEGLFFILDENGECLGYVARTLPFTEDVVGYRGPSDLLLFFDKELTLSTIQLLKCYDTPEHVATVKKDWGFLRQFAGRKWGHSHSGEPVDGVSGATLTSLAIAETISFRMSGQKPSLRFSNSLGTEDLALFDLPQFEDKWNEFSLDKEVDGRCVVYKIVGSGKERVGFVQRTGPIVDSISGYQGPSELVFWIDIDGKVGSVALRETFENPTYSDRLNLERFFWEVFENKTLLEVSRIDLQEEEVEGVSGATMTSMAVADTIVESAKRLVKNKSNELGANRPNFHWSWHDLGTGAVLITALFIAFSRKRGSKTIRLVWRIVLITYFGLVTGNLLSLVVLASAAASGIAWSLAPGLLTVLLVSIVIPICSKRNIYCSHLCPHGAAQQLLKGWFGTVKSVSLPRSLSRRLKFLPGILLAVAVVVTVVLPEHNLASWEPFHAYRWPVAGLVSFFVMILTLVLSGWMPMVYCRFGCPTGRFLEYIRHNASAARLCLADMIGCALILILWGRLWLV